MAQKFSKNDADEDKFFAVWEAMLAATFADLQDYFDNVEKSPALGNALWEAKAVDVWEILEKTFFTKIFDNLIKAGYNVGTVDSYCKVIYALFGDSASIEFVYNKLALTINIVAVYENFAYWFTRQGDQLLTKENDKLLLKTFLVDMTRAQILQLLQAITNLGTKINFNLN